MRNLQTSEREKEKENVPHRPYQAVASINHHMFIGLQHIIPIEFKACMFTHRPHPLYITRNVLDSKDHILSYFFPFTHSSPKLCSSTQIYLSPSMCWRFSIFFFSVKLRIAFELSHVKHQALRWGTWSHFRLFLHGPFFFLSLLLICTIISITLVLKSYTRIKKSRSLVVH